MRGRKRDAELLAAKLVAEVERGAYRDQEVSRHSVADLLEDWMAHIEGQGRAASTLTRYRSVISVNIVPRLGDVQITKLGPAQIDTFYGQLRTAGLGTLSIHKNHTVLSAAFNQAVRWGWLDRNSVDRASPPSARAKEIRPPTLDQLRQLVQECVEDHQDLGSLIYVAATTRARRGEPCGLRWSDLDLAAASITNETAWGGWASAPLASACTLSATVAPALPSLCELSASTCHCASSQHGPRPCVLGEQVPTPSRSRPTRSVDADARYGAPG